MVLKRSTTHSVLGSSSSLVVSSWMVVESDNTLTPIELDHHVGIEVSIVLGTRQVVVGLNQGIGRGVYSREEVAHLLRGVVAGVAEGLDFGEPLDVVAVVGEPDGRVESHFVVLSGATSTISSIALESFEKMLSKTL